MSTYWLYKFVHILGVVLLIGNVSVSSIWKVFADRTGNTAIVAYAQRLVIHTDWTLTGGGAVLVMLGGYGMTWEVRMPLIQTPWLLWSQVLFLASGLIWLLVLVPIQVAQSRLARGFASAGCIEGRYWRLGRLWLGWGIAATVPLVGALYLMVAKTLFT